MLQILIESAGGSATKRPRASWTAASVVAHVALVAGAMVLTARDAQRASDPVLLKGLVFVTPQMTTHRQEPDRTGGIVPMTDVRRDIPRIAMPSIRSLDPLSDIERNALTSLQTVGMEGEIHSTNRSVLPGAGGVFTSGVVDRTVVPHSDNGHPAFPSSLRASALGGDVLVRFVVDTTGRVERASIEIVSATHAQFGEAVRRWLVRTRYVAAEAQGRRVRQLVEQRVEFILR